MASGGGSKDDPIVLVSPLKLPKSPDSLEKCRNLVSQLSDTAAHSSKRKLTFMPHGVHHSKKRRTVLKLESDSEEEAEEDCQSKKWLSSGSEEEEDQVFESTKPNTIVVSDSEEEGVKVKLEQQSDQSCKSPVYEVPGGSYTGERILEILLDPDIDQSNVCRNRPVGVTRSSTFVVDLESLQHPEDIKKDDFGKWKYSGSHKKLYAAWQTPEGKLQFERISHSSSSSMNFFELRRVHCTHPSNPHCQRLMAFITDSGGNPHHLCYNIPPDGTIVSAHGNSKMNTPFYPTLPSTKHLVKSKAHLGGPKQIMSAVSKVKGGVVSAGSPCDLPRNERQIAYIQRTSKHQVLTTPTLKDPLADQIFAIMQEAKVGDRYGKFVRDTRPAPEPAFVLARDRQLHDIERFCTVPSGFSILTVDPTFKLGDFDVTPITYRHQLLETVRYETSPLFIGPTLIHYRKTFHTYVFFASSLIGLRRGLQGVRAFGTDGEKALADAFAHEFRYATHLTCFIHFRRNLKMRLHEQKFPESAAREILDNIFGCQQGEVFSEGLADSTSDDEFEAKLASLESRWGKIEESNAGTQPGFFRWFVQHKAETMKSTMLRPIREQAGLGCPPQPFTTNASETVNSVLKSHVNYKSSQLLEFVGKLKDVIDEQEWEIERAVIGRGKYRFKTQYSHFTVTELKWFKMTESQRRAHLDKVATGVIEPSATSSTLITRSLEATSVAVPPLTHGDSNGGQSLPTSTRSPWQLSVEVTSVAAEVTIPQPCLQGIWKKAEELLNSPGSITAAPGNSEEARMVLSRSGQRPHLVVPCKGGKYKCDPDCANFKSLGICSHSVVVAEVNKKLSEFLASVKKAKKKPNFTQLAVHDMPVGCGKKGGQAPRKRKKGTPPESRTDRITDVTQAASGDGATISQSLGTSNSMVNISLDSSHPGCAPYSSLPSPAPYSPLSASSPYSSSRYMAPNSAYTTSSPPPWISGSLPYRDWPIPPAYQDWHFPYMPTPSPQPQPAPVPPMAEEFSPFNLCFIVGNISKCAGCGNKYTKPPLPLYDLCVQHREWSSFTPSGGTPQSKFSPAYYHVNVVCLQKKWPSFSPQDLNIAPEVFQKLGQCHLDLLSNFGYRHV